MTEDERTELEIQRLNERALQNHYALQKPVGVESSAFCEECGNEIPEARRTALPGVTLCIGCKQAEERAKRMNR